MGQPMRMIVSAGSDLHQTIAWAWAWAWAGYVLNDDGRCVQRRGRSGFRSVRKSEYVYGGEDCCDGGKIPLYSWPASEVY